MLTFETVNELSLKVTCRGSDVMYAKAGAYIAGDCPYGKNFTFEKMMLSPNQGNFMQAAVGSLVRRVSGESLPLMKVSFSGDSVTYYANHGMHVIAYHLAPGEVMYVESENLLAFTGDCGYSVRFLGVGIFSQKGLATTCITGKTNNSCVAVICDGNPIVLSNYQSRSVLTADPDAVVCWTGTTGTNTDPQIKADVNWKTFIGQASGESYYFEWNGNQPVTVIIQPSERTG